MPRPAPTSASAREWKIGELAERLATTTKTLRHYEQLGLLAPPSRTAAAYRVYDAAALARATLVLGLRRLGLPIAAVAQALQGDPPEGELRHRVAALMETQIREADEQIGVLQGQREDMAARQRRLFEEGPGASCLCRLLSMPCGCGRVVQPE